MATQKQWFFLLDTDAKALRSWLVFTISSGGMTGALTFPSSLKVTLKEDNSFFMGIDTEEEKGILWLEWINPGNNSLQVQPRYVTPTGLGPTLSRFAVALLDAMARAWPDSKEQINEALEALGLIDPALHQSSKESGIDARRESSSTPPAHESPVKPSGAKVGSEVKGEPGKEAQGGAKLWEAIPDTRQREMVKMWWEGKDKGEIARKFNLVEKTVENIFSELRKNFRDEVPYRKVLEKRR